MSYFYQDIEDPSSSKFGAAGSTAERAGTKGTLNPKP